MNQIAKTLLSEARRLLAVRKVDERDNLEREFKNAIQDGEPVQFDYTKKDGSKKRREIIPLQLFKMRGRWAVKGYETRDPRQVQKVFYLDMIGDVRQEEEEPEPAEEVKVPSGFHVLEDDGIARSLYGVIKNGGLWKSAKQGNFLLSKVGRGNMEWRGKVWEDLKKKFGDAVGLVLTPLKEGSSGFRNRTVFVVDAEGVVARYSFWAKKFVRKERFDRMEDISDDYGGRVPQDVWDRVKEEGRYETIYHDYWKNGLKEKWRR